ncbi:cytochrome ubiquinol oxidase subunit I [Gemmatimonas sp.]|uniref:cytochrome ubiquinol oxidase subunit I n=1 Tax=Gemmatimonas sp. TaxID=1962908 RepID=UPI0022BC834F|nr:cytochrome ubiquinol oxidase subunit I [Gemmatimonas sp.]MCZ8203960.1 cytochrome ubiquinol oxidase subunit I [Gemmatimonas sp.]
MPSDLMFARSQMAMSLAFHIVFAVVGIGMPALMVIAEWRWLRTRDTVMLELAKRWAKGTAILFAVGAVSGTVLSFELGLLWPTFMEHAGAVIGMPFSLEGFAFFTEAIFLGIYLYAWKRIPPRAHLAAGVVVAVSGALSGAFVVCANAWMNAPAGFTMVNGEVTSVDPIAAMFNAAAPAQIVHMTLAAFAATGFAVAGIHAYALWRGTLHRAFHRAALQIALMIGLPTALLQPLSGDWSARGVAERQPVKLAAMEGHLRTGPAAFVIGGWPNPETLEHRGAIEIPGALSWLLHGDPAAVVPGIDSAPADERPPLAIVHLAFQIMVGCGTLMALLALWGAWRWWQRRGGGGVALPDDRRFLLAIMLAAPLGFIALEAGWTVTEVGRQPWIVQGILRTADAVTPMPGLGVTFALFTVLYIGLAIAVVFLLWRQILKTGVTPVPLGVTSELPLPSRLSGTHPTPRS